MGAYITDAFRSGDAKCGFSCGEPELDQYFSRFARSHKTTGVSKTWVYRCPPEESGTLPRVLGYYTLSMAALAFSDVAPVLGRRLPAHDIPVALIGRLAVEQRAQGRGLGTRLLLDAFRRVLDTEHVACVGIAVDAKHESAVAFYEKRDFVLVHPPSRMFVSLKTVRAAFD